MVSTKQPMTAEYLFRMPEDGFSYELVRGELKKKCLEGVQHGLIASNISFFLSQYVKSKYLGIVYTAKTGFKIASNPDTVRAPDVAYINQEWFQRVGDITGYWPGAPDLAVEVISPNDIFTEVEEKIFEWLEAETKMVIVVNPPKKIVTVYRSRTDIAMLTENDILDAGDVIPGWSMAIKDIFA